jgi:hypothetical protein
MKQNSLDEVTGKENGPVFIKINSEWTDSFMLECEAMVWDSSTPNISRNIEGTGPVKSNW